MADDIEKQSSSIISSVDDIYILFIYIFVTAPDVYLKQLYVDCIMLSTEINQLQCLPMLDDVDNFYTSVFVECFDI